MPQSSRTFYNVEWSVNYNLKRHRVFGKNEKDFRSLIPISFCFNVSIISVLGTIDSVSLIVTIQILCSCKLTLLHVFLAIQNIKQIRIHISLFFGILFIGKLH